MTLSSSGHTDPRFVSLQDTLPLSVNHQAWSELPADYADAFPNNADIVSAAHELLEELVMDETLPEEEKEKKLVILRSTITKYSPEAQAKSKDHEDKSKKKKSGSQPIKKPRNKGRVLL